MKEPRLGISAFVVLAMIALVAVLGAGVFYGLKKSAQFGAATISASPTPVQTIVPTATETPSVDVKDTTDTSLDKDVENEKTRMDVLDTDAKNIDEGMNDKQENLSE